MRKLTCPEAEPLLEAFQANELDGVTSLAVQEHVEECPLCQNLMRWNAEVDASLQRLSEATPAASSALRERVLGIGRNERHVIPAVFRHRALALAAAIIGLLVVASLLHSWTGRAPDAMAFVQNHIQTLANAQPVEFRTSDPAEAEEWLRTRVPFAPAVPRADGSRLVGARLCQIESRPVAFLLYERDGKPLSCFISADSQRRLRGFDTTAANRVRLGTCEGKNVAAWDAHHAGYVLVGDVPRESLVAFASQSAAGIRDRRDN
ncbi:MAG: anti-sigma factor [Chthoniobacterales bacterium]